MTEHNKKNEDWTEAAERFGQQLTRGLEVFGDRVQAALESIDEMSRPRRGVVIDDQRGLDEGEPVEGLRRGDVFDYRGDLYMRLGPLPEGGVPENIDAVNLENGEVRRFSYGFRVQPVTAKVVVEG